MQKKLIAVAVAGLVSGAAFAQSNVTIYGVMDTTWESVKTTDSTDSTLDIDRRSRMSSNSSHIGFKGAETLGNGLTAVFQYESGITSDEAGAMGGGRDTLIGVAGGFGTFAMGNLTGPVRSLGSKVDFNPGASSAGFTGLYGEVAGVKTGTDERSRNAVAYISPNFGGATIIAAYQNGTPASDATSVKDDSHLYTLGVTYAAGPIFVGAGYINANNPSVTTAVATSVISPTDLAALNVAVPGLNGLIAAADDTLKNFRVAGVLTLPSGTSISALYDYQDYEIDNITEATRKSYMVGVKQTFGANAVYGQFAVAKDLDDDLCDLMACGDTGAKQFTVGFIHEMSKRTMVHAFFTKLVNDDNVNYDHYVNAVGNADGADSTVIGAGLRHSF